MISVEEVFGLEEYQVFISLKNGESFSFFKVASSKDEVLNGIFNKMGEDWYYFVTEHYVEYRVKKDEIISCGIAMKPDQIKEYNNAIKERINK